MHPGEVRSRISGEIQLIRDREKVLHIPQRDQSTVNRDQSSWAIYCPSDMSLRRIVVWGSVAIRRIRRLSPNWSYAISKILRRRFGPQGRIFLQLIKLKLRLNIRGPFWHRDLGKGLSARGRERLEGIRPNISDLLTTQRRQPPSELVSMVSSTGTARAIPHEPSPSKRLIYCVGSHDLFDSQSVSQREPISRRASDVFGSIRVVGSLLQLLQISA